MSDTNAALLEALKLAVRQNEHDMLMTGEELRHCRAALAQAEAAQPVDDYQRGWNACMQAWADHMKRMNEALNKPLPAGWANHAHHIAVNVLEALAAAPQPAEAAPKPNSSATEAGARAQADAHVRALHWVRDGDKNCRYNNWVAETPLGRILITWKGWKEDHYATIDEFPGAELGVVGDPDELRDLAESEFWRRVDALAAQPQQPAPEPVARVPLTEKQMLDCVRSVGTPAPMGLTRDRGPYEVTEPTWFLIQLVRSVERAHGIAAAPQAPTTGNDNTEGRA